MNILVYFDGSSYARRALETGIKMGKGLNAEIHVYNAISPRESSKEVFEFIRNRTEDDIENAKKEIEHACRMVEEANLACQPHISTRGSKKGEDIIDFAGQIGADYIVIGVRTRSRVEKMVFGSTAQYVVLHSPCPVMTVN